MSNSEKVVRQSVAFEPRDYQVIKSLVRRKGLGGKGFSAAVRMIIREWEDYQAQEQARFYSQPNELVTVAEVIDRPE